jgi:hypothetical protein
MNWSGRFPRNILYAGAIGLFASVAVTATAADIEIGMNYNWWRFAPKTQEECRAHPAAPFRGNWLLPQYEEEHVRTTVKTQLREMHDSGFTFLKIFVWHRRSELGHDPEFFFSEDGSLDSDDKAKLQNLVRDIAAAGFNGLEVGLGFIDQNSPFCRKRDYGDCFEPSRTDENWRFASDVTKAVQDVAGRLFVVVDLANEGACPAGNMKPSSLLNIKRYAQTIASRWQSQFGNRWVMSCPNSAKAARLDLLVQYLGEIGIRPRYIEIHNYESDSMTIDPTLDEVQSLAERLGAHAILGEMQYHSEEKVTILDGWLRAHPQSPFIAMIMWPLKNPTNGGCGMDTGPPYTPGPLARLRRN